MTALSNFANVTLSSFYFDITKDCLYADSARSLERKSVVNVLQKVECVDLHVPRLIACQVLRTTTSIMAPVLPHLAEEINHHYNGGGDDISCYPSFFTTKWIPLVRIPMSTISKTLVDCNNRI
jgi:isoleucyl-tRNA synthetase